ncbi:MAG TPA: hypothetical protein VFU05_12595 [Cyclobacteriaceae bacterium]|nr:hypothetical protein [Cyclobacteriaceae bacterium]
MLKRTLFIGLMMVLLSACASFYEVSYDFNREFEKGNIDNALEQLQSDQHYAKSNVKFLYYTNAGLLLSMKGQYEESNKYFEKAYLFGEDFKLNDAAEIASYFTNPMITVYRGEDHEHLMPLYYKAINYLKMSMYEEALVECKRLNIRLQQLSDKYKFPHRFQRDAFIHNLMGIIYQANGDWNNAFIAYRNALEIYEEDYTPLFGVGAPDQLKRDLLVSAWRTGFNDEFSFYKEKFKWPDFTVESVEADLVFLWHNGLCPVKNEWSLNFAINHGSDNQFVFANENMPVTFPFAVNDEHDRNDLRNLEIFRVTVPRYVERPTYFTSAVVEANQVEYPVELAEDVSKIAFKSLQDRMTLEFSKSLLRAALKKAAEHSARKDDKGFGSLVGLINAVTEKADTRNWQTLPHSISYTRVPLKEGTNETTFVLEAPDGSEGRHPFTYRVKKGQTLFHTFSSLESMPARY